MKIIAKYSFIAACAIITTMTAHADVTCKSLSGYHAIKMKVQFKDGDPANIAGFGAHFSNTRYTDGYGGSRSECHMRAGANEQSNVIFNCYESYLKDGRFGSKAFHPVYELNLGKKHDISSNAGIRSGQLKEIDFLITPQLVDVNARRSTRSAHGGASEDSSITRPYHYQIHSSFPFHEDHGFFSSGQFCYSANGVLNNRRGREGRGYIVNVEFVK